MTTEDLQDRIDETKRRLELSTNKLVDAIKNLYPNKDVFQNNIKADELQQRKYKYDFITWESLGIRRAQPTGTSLLQDVVVTYYAEDEPEDTLDGVLIEIISAVLATGQFNLYEAPKGITQKGNEEEYVNTLEFYFTRKIAYGDY